MLLAHGGEITADEIGELALLSLPVVVLLLVFVVLADRARAGAGDLEPPGDDGPAPPAAAEQAPGQGR